MASDLLSGMLLAAVLVSLVGAEVGTLPKMEHVNETVFLEGLETCDADGRCNVANLIFSWYMCLLK